MTNSLKWIVLTNKRSIQFNGWTLKCFPIREEKKKWIRFVVVVALKATNLLSNLNASINKWPIETWMHLETMFNSYWIKLNEHEQPFTFHKWSNWLEYVCTQPGSMYI